MTEFQREVVSILKEDGGRMKTEEIAKKTGRAEKSVKKALKYLHGAEIVRDYQMAPPKKVPLTKKENEVWKEKVKVWKESGNPQRKDRWELIPDEARKKTLEI